MQMDRQKPVSNGNGESIGRRTFLRTIQTVVLAEVIREVSKTPWFKKVFDQVFRPTEEPSSK